MPRRRSSAFPSWTAALLDYRPLGVGFLLLASLTAAGTLGYAAIEGMGPIDALYMTVITLSTVGFHEVHPLSAGGRAFTMGLIVLGVGAVFYSAGAIAGFLFEGKLRAVLERLPRTPVVVVDLDPSLQPECEEAGHLFLHGSALEEATLRAAGIERARALIAATGSDPDNVFISLSARELRPDLRIHARAETPAGVRRLGLAGAQQIVSPHQLAGRRIANALLRPGVVEFLELADPGTGGEVDLEEIVIREGCPVDGMTLRQLRERDLEVAVVAIGDHASLARLSKAAQPG